MSLVSVLQKRKEKLDAIADVNSYLQVKHGLRKALEEAAVCNGCPWSGPDCR